MRALLLIGLFAVACHPDPACAPGQATLDERACAQEVYAHCAPLAGTSEYADCLDEGDAVCDLRAHKWAEQCKR